MSVQGEDKETTEPAGSADQEHRADGLIDFTQYSLTQLKDLQFSIDSRTYPENFNNLLRELARREPENAGQGAPALRITGRFTSHDGLRGWLEALRKRCPLYGSGAVEVRAADIVLFGWQRTWLAVPMQTQLTIPLEDVCNAVKDGSIVRFERRLQRTARTIFEIQAESLQQASELLALLPTVQTASFEKRWSEFRDFNRALDAVSGRARVTPAIVILNFAVFIGMAAVSKRPGAFDLQLLLAWGGNFGLYTVNGQWWRLITALFIHLNLLHLFLNMWAFWNVGRLAERLYGRWVFVFLYAASGLLASLASVAWDPSRTSVGASGAIFGIFGAFLAFLAHRKKELPPTIVRAHLTSTTLFVLFNLISGFGHVGVDNAAHVGGLISGFTLGWVLARPLNVEARLSMPLRQSVAALALTAVAVLAGLWQVNGIGAQLTIPEQYFRDHAWYISGEGENLRLWQDLATRTAAGSISPTEIGRRFELEIVPFWQSAHQRLRAELKSLPAAQRPLAVLVDDFVSTREQWARAVVSAAERGTLNDAATVATFVEFAHRTDQTTARIELATLRANMDHRPRALANNALFARVRALFTRSWKCIDSPDAVVATGSTTDGPAIRKIVGCDAQRLFMAGDYSALDRMMTRSASTPADLPDGSSSFDGVVRGLSNLFEFGGMDPLQAFGRTSDWRHAVPDSVEPDLVEAMMLSDWAWTVRGHGSANDVNAQALMLFAHRNEMAGAGLDEIAHRAAANPLWYSLSSSNGLDRSVGIDKMRAIFDAGVRKFPRSLSLYRNMLRALMPRWGGSYDQVPQFIKEMSEKTSIGPRFETYARLYWIYAVLEGGDINIFSDAQANWESMRVGLKEIRARYPDSESVLNAYAKFACLGNDPHEYGSLRPLLKSNSAGEPWTDKITIASCDNQFAVARANPDSQGHPGANLAGVAMSQTSAADLIAKAQLAFDRQDWATMKSTAQQLIDADPKSPNGYGLAASAAGALHDYDAAKSNYRKFVKLAPKSPDGWYGLGEVDIAARDYAEAEDAFTRALGIDPRMWAAWSERSVVREALGRRPAALQDAQTACNNGYSFACRLVEELQPTPR
jgi:membrane associated rhomboid family serine protease/tetratricopeptide (TPR) repeat protein